MRPLGLGVVGAGRFAHFLADAVANLPRVRLVAAADQVPDAARSLADAHHAGTADRWADLLADDAVDVVVVTTPPHTHAEIARAALEAGRHVFCEKPLATDADDAAALVETVERTGRVLVVDHVLRYNPLLRALTRLEGDLLGRVQRFCFENDAADEDLHDGHWFWDRARSGGILVEHGVHFFDAAAMLVGRPATSVVAAAAHREHGPADLVSATAHHGPHALATHTHSFTHAHRCERQLMRLDYGAAEARVEGWIPVEAVLEVWTDDAGAAVAEALPSRAAELLEVPGFRLPPQAEIAVEVSRDAGPPCARGRGRDLRLPHHARIRLTLGGPAAKPVAYAESVRAAMTDLVRCVDTGRSPVSGVQQGADAVAVALAATEAADTGRSVDVAHQTRPTTTGTRTA